MRKMLSLIFVSLVVLLWAGYCFTESQVKPVRPTPSSKPKHEPPVKPGLIQTPSIVTELKWDLVRYLGPASWDAIVRITATFKNVGGAPARCPDDPCRAVLRKYPYNATLPRTEVINERIFTTLPSGQQITFIKDIKVSCSREFTETFEAFHDVNVENPSYYIYHDPDYLRPSNTTAVYDDNLNDNRKVINERDIMNALWGFGCQPKR